MPNFAPLNSYTLNGLAPTTVGVYAGSTCALSQTVGRMYVGSVCTLQQAVNLRLTYVGSVCDFAQNVKATYASAGVCKVSQRVRTVIVGDFYSRNGWDFDITIGNTIITPDMVHGNIGIDFSESSNNLAEFELLMANPVPFIDTVYDGASEVVINYYDNTGAYRVYTGLVDSPQIDIINKTVTLKCNNQRDELINNKLASLVQSIGRYSLPIQGEYTDVASELDLRLQSTPTAVDFNSYNTPNVTSWLAKATPDYVLTDSDVYRRQPVIDWQDRANIVNQVVVNLKYTRTRLYHYQQSFDWTASYFGDQNDYFYYQYSTPTVAMIENAISQTSWTKVDSVVYVEPYPILYNWFGLPYTVKVEYAFDDLGNIISDPLGNSLYKTIPPAVLETVNVMKANWTAAIRFAQFIVEDYVLTVNAPQSIAQNGTVTSNINDGYQDEYDASEWEDFKKPVNTASYYTDIPELVAGTLNQAILAELDIARTSILSTHRGTQVTVQVLFMPDVELKHTIEIATDKISCKGKVVKIRHLLDTNDGDKWTELTIALFRAQGSATETARVSPTRPTYTPTLDSNTVYLGNHYGTPAVSGTITDTWNGMIGSLLTYYSGQAGDYTPDGYVLDIPFIYTFRTEFVEEFRVDTPAIPDTLRSTRNLIKSATYDIVIPNDPLDIDLSGR